MDVVTFNWNSLPSGSKKMIRQQAIDKYGYSSKRAAPVGKWLKDFCSDVTLSPIYVTHNVVEKYIRDFDITMPREKYVEFCLTWL